MNQKEFTTILDVINPKMVHFHEMKVEDLTPLEALDHVEVLSLEWNTKAKTLWDLAKNTALTSLSIKDFSKLENICGLKNNSNLEIMDLSGGIWNTLKLATLSPLKNHYNLKYLGLSNIKVQDESLEPVSYLKGLQELEISNQFPTEEYARLSVCLPNTNSISFRPYTRLNSPIEDKDVLVTGKRKPFLNSQNDVEKLRKYEVEFRKLQEKFREELKNIH
ncbi:leucine-rich repeat domain-containing protein [Paenibacillus montanisoli]|uniref:leucine-rich repeat domain-containing protein n=1 Tax=Paenibacillus montanisoli TaxID=2081970 RepID=UPI001F0C9C1C|nr:leucine-rich repeat domain-containing protein [Paenibacillus montanisoli]